MAVKVANNQSMTGITAMPSSVSGGAWTLLSTQTASSSATVSFTSGIDDTYNVYCFKMINIHPETDNKTFSFNFSSDGGSNYNVTKTTSWFQAYNNEADDNNTLAYVTGQDLAQGTGFQTLSEGTGNDNDQCYCGQLYLYDPSNTTFVKHFMAVGNDTYFSDFLNNIYVAGYCNTTSAVNAIQFKFNTGDVDAGVIKLYGIS